MSKFDVNTNMNFAEFFKALENKNQSQSQPPRASSSDVGSGDTSLDKMIIDQNTNKEDTTISRGIPIGEVRNTGSPIVKGTVVNTGQQYNPYGSNYAMNNMGSSMGSMGNRMGSMFSRKPNPENERLQTNINEFNKSKEEKTQKLNNTADEIDNLKREKITTRDADKSEIDSKIAELTTEKNLLNEEIQTIDSEIIKSQQQLKENNKSKTWGKTKKFFSDTKTAVSNRSRKLYDSGKEGIKGMGNKISETSSGLKNRLLGNNNEATENGIGSDSNQTSDNIELNRIKSDQENDEEYKNDQAPRIGDDAAANDNVDVNANNNVVGIENNNVNDTTNNNANSIDEVPGANRIDNDPKKGGKIKKSNNHKKTQKRKKNANI